MENQENNTKKYMTAVEAATLLSETLKNISERKIPLRQGLAMSRIALALSKTIEVADMEKRITEIESRLNNQGKRK